MNMHRNGNGKYEIIGNAPGNRMKWSIIITYFVSATAHTQRSPAAGPDDNGGTTSKINHISRTYEIISELACAKLITCTKRSVSIVCRTCTKRSVPLVFLSCASVILNSTKHNFTALIFSFGHEILICPPPTQLLPHVLQQYRQSIIIVDPVNRMIKIIMKARRLTYYTPAREAPAAREFFFAAELRSPSHHTIFR